jgi:hypothetical protein
MALRSSLPVYLVGALCTATMGLGLGFGLGQYTVTGMDPFIGVVRSAQAQSSYRPEIRDNEYAAVRFASAETGVSGVFDQGRSTY